jgi:tetratricopeptide (TPR) repeat protein
MELTVEQALQQAVAAHQEGRLQDAERLYRAILQARPRHADANHNLGVLAVAVGKPFEAIPLFKLALETNPQIEQFWLSYIDALIKLGRFDEVKRAMVEGEESGVSVDRLDAFNQRLQGALPNDKGTAAKGQTVSDKRKKLAEKKQRKKRKAQGDSSGAAPSQDQINLLMGHYQAGRLEEAEALATLLTQQFPRHPFAWKVLGVVLKQTNRLSESLAPLQSAVNLSPKDAAAYNNLGITLQELGRLDEAEATLRQAIALKSDFVEAHFSLGNFLQELGRLDEAEASYRHVIVLKPDYAEAHNNLGNTLTKPGRLDEAEASLRQAIALKPDFAKAHYNLGNTLRDLGRLDEAEASYRQAITLKPDFAEAHRNLAATKTFSSQDEQFRQMKALYRDSDFAEDQRCHICFALAKASEDLEDFASAFQFYAEGNALRKKPLGYDK